MRKRGEEKDRARKRKRKSGGRERERERVCVYTLSIDATVGGSLESQAATMAPGRKQRGVVNHKGGFLTSLWLSFKV